MTTNHLVTVISRFFHGNAGDSRWPSTLRMKPSRSLHRAATSRPCPRTCLFVGRLQTAAVYRSNMNFFYLSFFFFPGKH